jgi:hypothetical protein
MIVVASLIAVVGIADAQVSLVPGTNGTYTNGTYTWAGNQFCAQTGMLLMANSPAIDAAPLIPGFHCATSGPHPGETCHEWYGGAPDIGACEFVLGSGPPPVRPNPPTNLKVQ